MYLHITTYKFCLQKEFSLFMHVYSTIFTSSSSCLFLVRNTIIYCMFSHRFFKFISFFTFLDRLGSNVWNDMRLLAPDAIIFVISLLNFIYVRKLTKQHSNEMVVTSDNHAHQLHHKLELLATVTYATYGRSLNNIK